METLNPHGKVQGAVFFTDRPRNHIIYKEECLCDPKIATHWNVVHQYTLEGKIHEEVICQSFDENCVDLVLNLASDPDLIEAYDKIDFTL